MITELPLPLIDEHNKGFWEGCQRRELLVQRCRDCGSLRFPPRPMCPSCNSFEADWAPMSGKGKVLTWAICYPPVMPAFADKVPYNIAIVELDEGVRVVTNLVDCAPDQIEAGMPVSVVFEDVADDVTLAKFKRA